MWFAAGFTIGVVSAVGLSVWYFCRDLFSNQ